VWWVRSPNRQLNAAINLYMRMSFGYTEKVGWWKEEHTTEDGGRFPEGVVGARGSTLLGWVRPDRGKAE